MNKLRLTTLLTIVCVLAINVAMAAAPSTLIPMTKLSPSAGQTFKDQTLQTFQNFAAENVRVTVTGADLASAGTGTATIQAYDGEGAELAENVLARVWVGTAAAYVPAALTGFSVTTGTTNVTHTANAIHDVVSDATGEIVMALDAGGADSVWVWASVAGQIYASGEIVLTAP